MAGSQADETDWENMTNKELHDKFQQMMSGQVQDVLNRFEEAMEKIDGVSASSATPSWFWSIDDKPSWGTNVFMRIAG